MDCIVKLTVSRSLVGSFVVLICATSFVYTAHGSIRDAINTQDDNLISCPENWDLFSEEKTCFSRPSETEVQTHEFAQTICRRHGGYLASATDPQIKFISENYAVNPYENKTEMQFWMNYVMIHNSINSSNWNVAQEPVDEQQPDQLPTGLFPTSVPKNLSDKSVVCLQLLFRYNRRNKMDSWTWKAADCKQRVPYMCEKPASGRCVDRLGDIVAEGEQFSPRSQDDPCIRCHCYQGTPSVCSSASCGKPICDVYIPDSNECCKYNCVDGNGNIYIPDENNIPPVYLGDSMRWVLTMVTSFLLLGMMLFMVYRMRQKRLAYLRYRVRQFQESQMDFEPGSGPPMPSVDDLDGGFFREPPPPYSFFKNDAMRIDAPPPYQRNCNHQPRRLVLDRSSYRSDEVSLLRSSATSSLPASPASDQASAPVFITPPESPDATSPDENLQLTAAYSFSESAATTPIESTTSTPLTANTSMTSFLGDPMTSPGRNTAV